MLRGSSFDGLGAPPLLWFPNLEGAIVLFSTLSEVLS